MVNVERCDREKACLCKMSGKKEARLGKKRSLCMRSGELGVGLDTSFQCVWRQTGQAVQRQIELDALLFA